MPRGLNYGLEEQKADLDLYFSNFDCGKATVADTWLSLESYRSFIPASATRTEKQSFIANLEVLLCVMAPKATNPTNQVERGDSGASLLTTEEVSRWLGVSSRTVRLWAESGEIPTAKVGRQWRFRRDDIQEWLKRKRGDNGI